VAFITASFQLAQVENLPTFLLQVTATLKLEVVYYKILGLSTQAHLSPLSVP